VCQRQPDALAVVDEKIELTYAQLDRRSAWLAGQLRRRGVPAGCVVGMRQPRGADAVVAILGILRHGCAYLPIDPAYPSARQHLLETEAQLRFTVDEQLEVTIARVAGDAPPVCLPADPAYVIYTSGSTGTPKGVLVGHRHVASLMRAAWPRFRFDRRDRISMFHSPSFDFSVWEMWSALLYGGCLVVVPDQWARDPYAVAALLADRRVTVLNQVPSAFAYLVQAIEHDPTRPLPALRHVIFGGEPLNVDAVQRWRRVGVAPDAEMHNMYGITETTVHVTHHQIVDDVTVSPDGGTDIGAPLPHLQVQVVDDDLREVPDGSAGEMVVTGAGVSHGYLHRPDLTASRFVQLPDSGLRGYRSGDWALRAADGTLWFLGRRDRQVKIRGYRVELREVESALAAHPSVAACVVDAAQNALGEPVLAAHFVTRPQTTLSEQALRAYLGTVLPGHMVPNRIVWHEHLPVGRNGKVDRVALERVVTENGGTGA
jgi:amino acid adenylation domain-containing protein